MEYGAIGNGGTKENKTLSLEGKLDHNNPKRPQVQKGYK